MTCHNLDMLPAFRTLWKIRAFWTGCSAAFILPVSVPVCCAVCQHFIVGADITIIILIIYIFIFLEKSLLGHWSFVRQERLDPVIYQKLCDRRSFIACICNQCFYADAIYLVIQSFKSSAVMQIPGVNCITKNPAVLITGSLYCVGKYILVFPFAEPSAFGIRSAAVYCFGIFDR